MGHDKRLLKLIVLTKFAVYDIWFCILGMPSFLLLGFATPFGILLDHVVYIERASVCPPLSSFSSSQAFSLVSRQLVYGHFVYDTSSTDISSTITFVAEIEAGVMKRKLCQ